jgi:hypothetical protein
VPAVALAGDVQNDQRRRVDMPIRPYLADRAAFGPDTIAAMSKAFEEACIALRVFAGDEKCREIVATRIMIWREMA